MTLLTKIFKVFLIASILCFSFWTELNVSAEKAEPSVEDTFKNKDKIQEEQTEKTPSDNPEPLNTSNSSNLTFTDFLRVIAAFIFVIALLYGLLRFINKKSRSYQKGGLIKNLGGSGLGNGKSIQLVKIGSKVYIVGVGEDVQLLSEITNEEEIQELLEEYNSAAEKMLIPSDFLSKIVQNNNQKSDNQKSFTEQLKKQLAEMTNNRKQLRKEVQKKVNSDNE